MKTRREALKQLGMAVGGVWFAGRILRSDALGQEARSEEIPATGKTDSRLKPLDELMTSFVKAHQVPGAALAVKRGNEMIYSRGFGYADADQKTIVGPESLFRIASVSKPLTAVAILNLVGESKFRLEDRVFDILPVEKWLSDKCDVRLKEITVRQLLQHTGGWDRAVSFDPIGRPREAVKVLGKSLPASADDITRYTLTLPLDFDPGTRFAYSNVGYLLLGRIIEQASGQSYGTFVQEKVLAPAGAKGLQIGRSSEATLAKDEVRYFDRKKRMATAVSGERIGVEVPLVYGGENFEAYEAHGGWIASAPDLVRFAAALSGNGKAHLLPMEMLREITKRPTGFQAKDEQREVHYGLGFNVRSISGGIGFNLWHTGLIVGTSSLLVLRHDGFQWAVLFNTDRSSDGSVLSGLIDPLIHQAVDSVAW